MIFLQDLLNERVAEGDPHDLTAPHQAPFRRVFIICRSITNIVLPPVQWTVFLVQFSYEDKKIAGKNHNVQKITVLLSSHVASSRPIFAELFRGLLSQSSSKHFHQLQCLGILCILVTLVLLLGDLSKSLKIDQSLDFGVSDKIIRHFKESTLFQYLADDYIVRSQINSFQWTPCYNFTIKQLMCPSNLVKL